MQAIPVNQLSSAELRFVVLLHQPGSQSERTAQAHLDWMFQRDGRLMTWATPPIDLGDVSRVVETDCEVLPAHRLAYLDHEGEVSGDRGTVRKKLAGYYRCREAGEDRFLASIRWQENERLQTAEVEIYRSFLPDEEGRLEERRESWRLRFSAG